MKPIRILFADDHVLFRAGIRALLEKIPGVEVVGEVATGREALNFIQTRPPNLVLMDILMPEMNGLAATARVAAQFPNTRVIILSMTAAEEYVLQTLRAGAVGYLLKNVTPVELELAVKAVGRGQTFLCSAVSKHVMDAYVNRMGGHSSSLERMTPRQREVLQLVSEGNSTKETATKLDLRVKTVEMHRTQLIAALDIHDVAGLVRYAIRMGIISPDA